MALLEMLRQKKMEKFLPAEPSQNAAQNCHDGIGDSLSLWRGFSSAGAIFSYSPWIPSGH